MCLWSRDELPETVDQSLLYGPRGQRTSQPRPCLAHSRTRVLFPLPRMRPSSIITPVVAFALLTGQVACLATPSPTSNPTLTPSPTMKHVTVVNKHRVSSPVLRTELLILNGVPTTELADAAMMRQILQQLTTQQAEIEQLREDVKYLTALHNTSTLVPTQQPTHEPTQHGMFLRWTREQKNQNQKATR